MHNPQMLAINKSKGKGDFYLTWVVPSVPTRLLSMEANGAPSTPPCHCQCSVLQVFKAMATRIRGTLKVEADVKVIEDRTGDLSLRKPRTSQLSHDCSLSPLFLSSCYQLIPLTLFTLCSQWEIHGVERMV